MIRVAVVGIGKMGLSHLSMVRAHPDVELVAVCDSAGYVLDVLAKYTGLVTFTDYHRMISTVEMDAILIATPTASHNAMVREALERGIHVFCEKPLTLSARESEELAALARKQRLVTQVGYHNRFVGAFQEAQRIIQSQAIGEVTHVLAESYGPVVLKTKGTTWRSRSAAGGGCLYDYAAHPLDLLTWFFGGAVSAGGSVLTSVFSAETDDQVYSTLAYSGGVSAQLSVDWSDESLRKMTTKVSIWGTTGKVVADRQECQVYLRETAVVPEGYQVGWNLRYTTELTSPVWFYLRGEEYSAQIDYFVKSITDVAPDSRQERQNSFSDAAVTDLAIEMVGASAASGETVRREDPAAMVQRPTRKGLFGRATPSVASSAGKRR